MHPRARLVESQDILPLRTRYREEMNCQIVHDSIHSRKGWTLTYALEVDSTVGGFGSVAIGGPWKNKPTAFELYIAPEHRTRAFAFFEAFLAASGARFFEIQTNDALCLTLALTYGRDIGIEKVVFRDDLTTSLAAAGAILRRVTAEEEILACLEERAGGGEWLLESEGKVVGKGGILFHYNRPYGDIYMEVEEPFRRRGLGSYLVQELKRECYKLGAVPGARCDPTNVASRQTLQKAGFVPFAHILTASVNLP